MTAHNIVDYRRQIGGFKKVEDLALVSGVGATKLNALRMEITVGRKKSSQSSSRSSSKNDLSITQGDNTSSASSRRSHPRTANLTYVRVNLNTSNVFQLMKVKEISQTIAENIVVYRDKKGPFKSIDDLIRIKGMRPSLLSAIRPHLTLSDSVRPEPDVVPHLVVGNGLPVFSTPPSAPTSASQSHSRGNSSSGTSLQQQTGVSADLFFFITT